MKDKPHIHRHRVNHEPFKWVASCGIDGAKNASATSFATWKNNGSIGKFIDPNLIWSSWREMELNLLKTIT